MRTRMKYVIEICIYDRSRMYVVSETSNTIELLLFSKYNFYMVNSSTSIGKTILYKQHSSGTHTKTSK